MRTALELLLVCICFALLIWVGLLVIDVNYYKQRAGWIEESRQEWVSSTIRCLKAYGDEEAQKEFVRRIYKTQLLEEGLR